jgi:hypothetical protein
MSPQRPWTNLILEDSSPAESEKPMNPLYDLFVRAVFLTDEP